MPLFNGENLFLKANLNIHKHSTNLSKYKIANQDRKSNVVT